MWIIKKGDAFPSQNMWFGTFSRPACLSHSAGAGRRSEYLCLLLPWMVSSIFVYLGNYNHKNTCSSQSINAEIGTVCTFYFGPWKKKKIKQSRREGCPTHNGRFVFNIFRSTWISDQTCYTLQLNLWVSHFSSTTNIE